MSYKSNNSPADFSGYSKNQKSDQKPQQVIFEVKPRLTKRTKILLTILIILATAQGVYYYITYKKNNPSVPAGYEYVDNKNGPPTIAPISK